MRGREGRPATWEGAWLGTGRARDLGWNVEWVGELIPYACGERMEACHGSWPGRRVQKEADP
jgi:hypothetical protein